MLTELDAMLRSDARYSVRASRMPWPQLSVALVAAGFGYGFVMGAYGGRLAQELYSAIKVPLLLVATSLVCLPNFFVVNTMLGLREDFSRACRGLLAAQSTIAVVLMALAPITVFVYVSHRDYRFAVLYNGVVFALATAAGQVTLGRHYKELVAKNPRHRIARATWVTLYVFVAIQLAWVLRPFVGAPDMETRFFREDAWTNAYVQVFASIVRYFGG